MEELKILVDMVAHLPQMALWVLCGFLIYKLAVVGSIYGTIRFVVEKFHSWKVTPRHELEVKEVRAQLDGMTIKDAFDPLLTQLHRLPNISMRGGGNSMRSHSYIHMSDVDWLRSAIDEKLAKEKK